MSVRVLVEAAIRLKGSEAKLGTACGVTQTAIWKAKTTGRVSPRLAVKIEAATGIDRGRLCPGVFDPPKRQISLTVPEAHP